jgi:hypothetical protein
MGLISNTDSSTLPYNDSEMVYDIDRHMYILTDTGVKRLLGYDLRELTGNDTAANIVRYETSQDVYNHIATYSMVQAYKYKVWLIAKADGVREKFKRILADQMRYYITSGAGSIKDMHGINISSGKAMNLSDLRGNVLVSASVDSQLSKLGLLYTGPMYYSNFKEDGTW